jgi:hypothetical protein
MASHEHKFNDDLLLAAGDLILAAEKYPSIWHVLDHPALRELFLNYDGPARRAKSRGLTFGLIAIALGFVALAVAALESLFIAAGEKADSSGLWLSVGSFVCAAASLLIGNIGVLFGARKRDWLQHRLMAESLRQFHFQSFVFRLPEILASLKDEVAKEQFRKARELRLQSFAARMEGKLDSAFAAAIREEEDFAPWGYDGAWPKEASTVLESEELDPLFEAYRELRILHQLGYAEYKLQDHLGEIFAFPRTQLSVLSTAALIWVVLLILFHAGLLVGAFSSGETRTVLHSGGTIYAIIFVALLALATRAVEQGLQPEREIERYQQYRSAVRTILERFDDAPSRAAKVRIIREMEQLAVEEMRNFLITGERSRYVM